MHPGISMYHTIQAPAISLSSLLLPWYPCARSSQRSGWPTSSWGPRPGGHGPFHWDSWRFHGIFQWDFKVMIEEGVVIVIESLEFNPNSIFFDGIFFHGSLQCFDGISPYHPHSTYVQYVHIYIYLYVYTCVCVCIVGKI